MSKDEKMSATTPRELGIEAARHLQELWDQGKSSGQAVPLDFDDLRQEAHQRLKNLSASTR